MTFINILSELAQIFLHFLFIVYLGSLVYILIHEIIIRLYIILKIDKNHSFTIPWAICILPVINTLNAFVSIEFMFKCLETKQNYFLSTATQYYENGL